jgi:site-specific DNA-methyltransferase (adenine-specific)
MEPTDILGNIKLYNADCMEVMKTFKDKQFDLAIVDPPFGIGMDNQKVRTKPNRPNSYLRAGENQYKESKWDDSAPNQDYFKELFRISKNQIIWGANYFPQYMPSGRGWIYWDKQMGENLFSSGEFAFQSLQVKSSFFSCPSMRVAGTRIHPTQKPVQLYKWLLKNYAKEGDTILDTHFGSLSIGIACHDMKFDLTAIELDKDYYEQAKERLINHQKQLTLF